MMDLILMRHAEAVNTASTDSARQLTDRGKAQATAVGEMIARQCAGSVVVVASPFVRARKTATIVAACMDCNDQVLVDDRLAPGMRTEEGIAVILEQNHDANTMVLVGHAPDLSLLAAYLIGADNAEIQMRKSAAACLDMSRPGHGGSALCWLVNPGLLS